MKETEESEMTLSFQKKQGKLNIYKFMVIDFDL